MADFIPDQKPVDPLTQALAHVDPSDAGWLSAARQVTPARIFTGRTGVGYQTSTQLELRCDHAVALDAVHTELEIERDLGPEFVEQWRLFTIQSEATSKSQYLMRPDLGRRLDAPSRHLLQQSCPAGAEFQIAIGDGLSAAAVIEQVPLILPGLMAGAAQSGWSVGQPFVIRYCRVGILNEIGEILRPQVVVLLIGERPGLATAQSLSAYFAFQPQSGHSDAQRNLISNIHSRGVKPDAAIQRILAFAQKLRTAGRSGFEIKEDR